MCKRCTGNPETSIFDGDSIKSVCIKQTITGMKCTYALACKGEADNISTCIKFDPCGNGEKLWNDLKKNGKLTEDSVDENFKGRLRSAGFIKYYIFN